MLLTAAAIGESLAFIGGLFGSSTLVWVGYATVIAPVLFVIAKLVNAPKDLPNTTDSPDRSDTGVGYAAEQSDQVRNFDR